MQPPVDGDRAHRQAARHVRGGGEPHPRRGKHPEPGRIGDVAEVREQGRVTVQPAEAAHGQPQHAPLDRGRQRRPGHRRLGRADERAGLVLGSPGLVGHDGDQGVGAERVRGHPAQPGQVTEFVAAAWRPGVYRHADPDAARPPPRRTVRRRVPPQYGPDQRGDEQVVDGDARSVLRLRRGRHARPSEQGEAVAWRAARSAAARVPRRYPRGAPRQRPEPPRRRVVRWTPAG